MKVIVLLAVVGCSSVSDGLRDAGTAEDAESVDAAAADAPPDVPSSLPASAVSLRNISPFAVPYGLYTKAQFIDEAYDRNDEYDLTTGRFTAKETGDYMLCGALNPRTPSGNLQLTAFVDEQIDISFAYGRSLISVGCGMVHLEAGHYLDVRAWQSVSTTGFTIPADPNNTWLSINRVDGILSVKASGRTTVPNTTFVKLAYDTEAFDTLNAYDPATNKFTAPAAGDYLFCASTSYNPGIAEIDLFVNDVRLGAIGRGTAVSLGCRSARMTANQVADVRIYQATGASLLTDQSAIWTWLRVARLPTSVSLNSTDATTISERVWTPMLYKGELFDTHGEYDVVGHVFNAAAEGDYLVCASVDTGSTTSDIELDTYVNSVRDRVIAANSIQAAGCRPLHLAQNAQLQLLAFKISTDLGTLSLGSNSVWWWAQISKL